MPTRKQSKETPPYLPRDPVGLRGEVAQVAQLAVNHVHAALAHVVLRRAVPARVAGVQHLPRRF